ncbi:MAG: hypothetical protein ACLRFI_03580 [Alphaproteobacteria bacterium]
MKNFYKIAFCLLPLLVATDVCAVQQPNPRSVNNVSEVRQTNTKNTARTEQKAQSVVSRTKTPATSNTKQVKVSRVAVQKNSNQKHYSGNSSGTIRSRSANFIKRTFDFLTGNKTTSSRSAVKQTKNTPVAFRTSKSRATAVFSDVSKIGGKYAQCREAYATCMDQFCANASDTYRRCYCSARFQDFHNKEEAIEQAKTLLAQFEANNLNAVNKSADEVNAMYSATVGENAIKQDTSGAAAILANVSDLLSGKAQTQKSTELTSLSGLSIDFSNNFDDIFGNSNNLFDSTGTDMTKLEGEELYNTAKKQCLAVIGDSCENDANLNMSQSAYSVMITQDCNLYQKKIDASVEQVKETVRTAEKYLREARLEDFRSHNSADVNECLDKVETALLQPTACGQDYVKCLDYTGAYINTTTGEPIYSPRFFMLNEIINLENNNSDVLGINPNFDLFLDAKKIYAESALDSCRGIADTVWYEFKRNALIKIAQAQDEKIQEVKDSCIEKMKECYDTQSGALKGFDDTTAQAAGVLVAYAAKDMCVDYVTTCAALYSKKDSTQCVIDKFGKVSNAGECGLASLLNFVDTVDSVRVAEGCETGLQNYINELCGDSDSNGEPWRCRLKNFGVFENAANSSSISGLVKNWAVQNCKKPDTNSNTYDDALDANTKTKVRDIVDNLEEDLSELLSDKCYEIGGFWISRNTNTTDISNEKLSTNFYGQYFGGRSPIINTTVQSNTMSNVQFVDNVTDLGVCIENSDKLSCLDWNSDDTEYATWDDTTQKCNLTEEWYRDRCSEQGGIYSTPNCYKFND